MRWVAGFAVAVCLAVAGWAWVRQAELDRGEQAFKRLGCFDCHTNGGPNLAYVADNYDRDTMVRFIEDPEVVYRERGKKPLNSGYKSMHQVKSTQAEIRAIAAYLPALQ